MPALSGPQMRNARIIAAVGRRMGMGRKAILVALTAAMTESSLINNPGGDSDSAGLFQMRPSMGWGSYQQVTDPIYASHKFFTELKQVGNWEHLGIGQAAQAVERSAYPGRYHNNVPLMKAILGRVTNGDITLPTGQPGNPVQKIPLSGVISAPQPPSVLAQLALGTPWTPLDTDGTPDPTKAPKGGVAGLGALGFPELGVRGVDPARHEAMPQVLPMGQDDFINIFGGGEAGTKSLFLPMTKGAKGVHGWRAAVVHSAERALGTPYVWGGNSLQRGVDCSGLVQQAFQNAGINLPRVSYQQANSGRRVALRDLKPGDLVAWNNSSRNPGADHIAIYIGHGRIIEAPRPGLSVRKRKLGRNEGARGIRMTP